MFSDQFRRLLILAAIAGVTLYFAWSAGVFGPASRDTGLLGGVAAGAALALLYSLMLREVLLWLRRLRNLDLRVSVTGMPAAGKTVFSVALFDLLMSEQADQVRFTAEARTVISVYQAIRGLERDQWPSSTVREVVNRYEGKLHFPRRRTILDLELGDSAGEYWAEFPNDSSRDSDYLAYVASSGAVVHVVAADWLTGKSSPAWPSGSTRMGYNIGSDFADLRLASRLMRPLSPEGKLVPLLIVISKADLIGLEGHPQLYTPIPINDFHESSIYIAATSAMGRSAISSVQELARSLQGDFTHVSVCFAAFERGMPRWGPRTEIAEWLLSCAREGQKQTRPSLLGRLLAIDTPR